MECSHRLAFGLGFGVWGFGFRVSGSGFRVSGSGLGFRVQGLRFRAERLQNASQRLVPGLKSRGLKVQIWELPKIVDPNIMP